MLRTLARLLLLLVIATAASPAAARSREPAQADDPRAQARDLGARAINALNKGQHEEAIELLRQAEKLFHAPTHLLFMARAHAELGRLVEAHDAYQAVVSERIPDYAPPAFHAAKKDARKELTELLERLPTVTITVSGAPAPDVAVTIDGAAIAPAKLAQRIALEPGGHVIEARVEGHAPVSRRVELKAGDVTQRIDLALDGEPADGDGVIPDGAGAGGPDDSTGPSPWVISGITALAVGGVSLGVGAVTGALTLGQASDIQDTCVDDHCPPDQEEDASSTKTLGNVATATFIIGGVAAAAGIVLLLAAPDDEDSSDTSATLRLRLAPASVGLLGTF